MPIPVTIADARARSRCTSARAASDVIHQLWVRPFGFGHFAPVMFATVGLLSFTLIPFFSAPLRQMPRPMVVWALGGGLLLTIQAMGIAYCIAVYHEVTVTNVLYNTRGLWSVALVWVVGHWFANAEKQARIPQLMPPINPTQGKAQRCGVGLSDKDPRILRDTPQQGPHVGPVAKPRNGERASVRP